MVVALTSAGMTTDTATYPPATDDIAPGASPPPPRKPRKPRKPAAKRSTARPSTPASSTPPPAASSTGDTAPKRGPGRPSKLDKRADGVTALLGLCAMPVMLRNQRDAEIILAGAPNMGQALAKLAETNSAVARTLDALIETSAYTEVAIAASAIIVPILANHGFTFGLPSLDRPAPAPTPAPTPPADGAFRADPAADPAPVVTGAVPPEWAEQPWLMPFTAQG